LETLALVILEDQLNQTRKPLLGNKLR